MTDPLESERENTFSPDMGFFKVNYSLREELSHRYGNSVHLLNKPFLLSLLARMGHPDTSQYEARHIVREAYAQMIGYVACREFPATVIDVPTRMQSQIGKQGRYRGPASDLRNIVVVSVERAGALPTDSIVDLLSLASGGSVRRDSITAERETDAEDRVTGCRISGTKIGGTVEGAYILIPDVMAATGCTLDAVIDIYQGVRPLPRVEAGNEDEEYVDGVPNQIIALHLIAAPEYLQFMRREHPKVIIYVARVDRGLSDQEVLLKDEFGSQPDKERGLTDKDYIVPGAGGMGEMLSGEAKREPFYERDQTTR